MSMLMRFAVPALAAPAILLSACTGTPNRGVESVHQPVVSRSDYALDLATSGDALASGENVRLAGWLQSLRLGFGDRVSVDDPAGSAIQARAEIAAETARYGLLLADQAPTTVGAVVPGTVRVVVTRMAAAVPGCPDYSRMYEPNFNAHTSSNYGCAVNSNLAAMVAAPGDLVLGQAGDATSDPDRATKAIGQYRRSQPTGNGALPAQTTGGAGGGN